MGAHRGCIIATAAHAFHALAEVFGARGLRGREAGRGRSGDGALLRASSGAESAEKQDREYRVGKHAGRKRFGGISFGAVPYMATSLHYVCYYFILYTLAGVASGS